LFFAAGTLTAIWKAPVTEEVGAVVVVVAVTTTVVVLADVVEAGTEDVVDPVESPQDEAGMMLNRMGVLPTG